MKNLNELKRLRNVKAPDELKERTLAAARDVWRAEMETSEFPERLEQPSGKKTFAPTPRRFSAAKRILAAACALGIVIGGTAVWKSRKTEQPAGDAVAESLANTFGFVAYAANSGETMVPKDSTIVFDNGSGCDDLEKGFYSGCLFRVTGENIQTISASIDKGCALYRAKRFDLSADVVSSWRESGGEWPPTVPGMEGADNIMVSGLGDEDADTVNTWWADTCWNLENGFVDTYDPDVSYGFWAPPIDTALGEEEEDLQQAWHGRVDTFEGATLNVTVTFTDGSQQTQSMALHSGKLGVEYLDPDGGPTLTGEVYDQPGDFGKPYVYGVYGEIQP